MFARHPLEKLPDKLEGESLLDAIRLAIIAELDAISFYTQVSRRAADEGVKRVFADVAREEKTHVGEFLEVLKRLDEEQARELLGGAQEALELMGLEAAESRSQSSNKGSGVGNSDPTGEPFSTISSIARKASREAGILRKLLPSEDAGGRDALVYYKLIGGKTVEETLKLEVVSHNFSIPERALTNPREAGTLASLGARRFALLVEEFILSKLRGEEGLTRMSLKDWETPGAAVSDISRAYTSSYRVSGAREYVLAVSPDRYASLLAYHERSGVIELERVRRLVGNVVPHPIMNSDEALLVPLEPSILSLVTRGLEVVDLGPDAEGNHWFRLTEIIGLKIAMPEAIVYLKA